jgi:hypothetical protein
MAKKKLEVPPDVLAFIRRLGSQGGKLGGKSRWKDVSPEERSAQMKRVRAAALVKKRRPKT